MFKHSKIGLRLFLLFLVTAVAPLAVTIAYLGKELDNLSHQQLKEQLLFDAQNYGAAIQGKLLTADIALRQLEETLERSGIVALNDAAEEIFAAVAHRGADGRWRTLFGDNGLLPDITPTAEGDRLFAGENGQPLSQIALFSRTQDDGASGAMVAIIRPEFLWFNEVASEKNRYTVFVDQKPLVTLARNSADGELHLIDRQPPSDDRISIRHRLLNHQFRAAPWEVEVSRRHNETLLPLTQSGQVLTIITFSILLLVALLSSRQIREIVAPLEKLTAATQRLARQDFYEPLRMTGKDEIGMLAKSFNSMSEKLGTQFRTLEGLTTIDESILTGNSLRHTCEIILREVTTIFACPCSVLCLLTEHNNGKPLGLYYNANENRVRQSRHERASLDDPKLPSTAASVWYNTGDGLPKLLAKGMSNDIQQLLVCPVMSQKSVIAYIGVGFSQPATEPDQLIAPIASFSRRIGVAIRSAQDAQKLQRRANYDGLTGLVNRSHFNEQLGKIIKQSAEHDTALVLLFIDLDRFKHVNDVQGHEAGDKLLQYVAARIKDCVSEEAIVARFGGDEFLVLLPETSSQKYAEITAKRIIAELSKPVTIGFHEHFVNASIGIGMYPHHGQDAETLIKHTDIAMYRAKQTGGGNFRVFDNSMNAFAKKRVALESALYHAIERDELFLVYQPKICLNSHRICGAEALVRWRHPIHGMISPDQFITIAEETGQILPIGNWIVHTLAAQLRDWKNKGLALEHMALNASVRQIKAENFVDSLGRGLSKYNIDPATLEVEITESMFMSDIENSVNVLKALRELGVSVAIDDFGTGYSSLSYLAQLPFDTLKIDRSFLYKVTYDKNAASLTSAIVALAHSLNKTVVAEGVETDEQVSFLQNRRCDLAQGYYFSKPLTAADFERYLLDNPTTVPVHGNSQQKSA